MKEQMLSYLRSLAARLAWDYGRLPPEFPEDPYAGVREPRRRGPGGKSTAVAVAEPEEWKLVRADGRPEQGMMADRSASGT